MSTYKNVIFDFSDTLCRFVAIDYLTELLGGDAEHAKKLHHTIFGSQAWRNYDRGKVTEQENKRILLDLVDPSDRAVADIYLDHWHEHYEIIDGMPQIISDLKSRGIGVYLLSDYPERFEKCWERFSFLHQVDGKLVSYQVGIGKTEPEFFTMLLEKYNLKAEECIFFDDRENLVQSGRSVGIDGRVFIDAPTTRAALGI